MLWSSPQILSWLHPVTHAAITRSSQPLVGLSTKKSKEDEALIQAIREANSDPSKTLFIMDARPWVNAVFNVVSGEQERLVTYHVSIPSVLSVSSVLYKCVESRKLVATQVKRSQQSRKGSMYLPGLL